MFRRLLAPLLIVTITMTAAGTAAADTTDITSSTVPASTTTAAGTPSTTVAGNGSTDPFAGLNDQYMTLAAALVAGQSLSSGQPLTSVLGANSLQWDAAFGAPGLFSATSFEELNAKLAGYTLGAQSGPDGLVFTSWDSLLSSLTATAGTPDGQMVAQSIDFGRVLGGLAQPELSMPSLGPAATIASAHGDEMTFGLFANQTIAQTLLNAPDVLGQITAGGKLSPQNQQLFNQQMASAGRTVNTSLSSALPSPCYAAMLTAMGTGNPASASGLGLSSECSPCISAGAYLHGRMGELIAPQGYTTDGTDDGRITGYEWSRLDATTRDAILALNPNLAAQLQQSQAASASQTGGLNANASACSASASGTTNFLGNTLSGVLSSLGS